MSGSVRSHHHRQWSVPQLVAAKNGHRISVVLPAKNEAASLGGIVAGIKAELVDTMPLVDELIVIDSDSTDDTAEVARDAGATVYAAAHIAPGQGAFPGKGEALWKAQFVATGDVLVFVDSDLVDWGTHFVTGLLGPLLTDPSIHLVKAVYDRPMIDAEGREEESGGRVTELVARPLIALHWPELADIVQPLSGEWAIRRSTFARFAVPVGYGVEIAALLDTASRHGAQAIAQVDLGRRTHRHHRHDALGQMAVQVLAAADNRRSGGPGPGDHVRLRQFARTGAGFQPRVSQVLIRERPPASTLLPLAPQQSARGVGTGDAGGAFGGSW